MRVSKIGKPCLLAVVCALGFALPNVEAEPIVYRNTSYIFGYVTVLQDGNPIPPFDSFDTSRPFSSQPTSGSWGITDSRTVNDGGAGATVQSSVGGNITPTQLSGRGEVVQTASATAARPDLGGQSWGRSITGLYFQVDQSSLFTFTGRYTAASDTTFGVLDASLNPLTSALGDLLPPLFIDNFRFFNGSLDQTTTHTGVLQPGSYVLFLADDPLFVTAPDGHFRTSSYSYTMNLAPTPEPATVLLLAAGLGAFLVARRYTAIGKRTSELSARRLAACPSPKPRTA